MIFSTRPASPVAEAKRNRPHRRLLLLCQEFYPEQIATGKSLTELSEELVGMGVDVAVICGQSTLLEVAGRLPVDMVYKGIRIHRVANTRFSPHHFLGKLLNSATFTVSAFFHLLRTPADAPLLVSTTPPFLAFVAALCAALSGRRFVLRVADVYPDTAVNLGILRERRPVTVLWHILNRMAYRRASAIIVLGRCMADVVNRSTGAQFTRKIHRIHVWGDDRTIRASDTSSADKNPFVTRWGLSDKFVVLYAGNMGRTHDIESIMESARRLRQDSGIVFLLVCSGWKRPWAMQFAADHDLANCRFHGYVERDMFPALLQTAAIGLTCLAKGQEGLSVPSKAYALMAAGVPQIAVMARSAEIARVVVEEGCGLWVVPGDVDGLVTAIRQARASPALLRRMAELARRANCEKYSLEAAAAQYYDLLQPLWQEIESDADCRSPRQPLRSTFLRSGSAPVSPRQGVGAGSRTGR